MILRRRPFVVHQIRPITYQRGKIDGAGCAKHRTVKAFGKPELLDRGKMERTTGTTNLKISFHFEKSTAAATLDLTG
jgi:hypothetical protein